MVKWRQLCFWKPAAWRLFLSLSCCLHLFSCWNFVNLWEHLDLRSGCAFFELRAALESPRISAHKTLQNKICISWDRTQAKTEDNGTELNRASSRENEGRVEWEVGQLRLERYESEPSLPKRYKFRKWDIDLLVEHYLRMMQNIIHCGDEIIFRDGEKVKRCSDMDKERIS